MSPTNETVERPQPALPADRIECRRDRPRRPARHRWRHTTSTSAMRSPLVRTIAGSLTDRGEMVRNRAEWTVDERSIRDRSLTATAERHGPTPGEYVAEHVDLAYARTGAGAQGRNGPRRPSCSSTDPPTSEPLRRDDPRTVDQRSVRRHDRRADRPRRLRPIDRHRLDRPPRPRSPSRAEEADRNRSRDRAPAQAGRQHQPNTTDPRPVGRPIGRREVGPACRASVPVDEEVERVDRHRNDPRRVGWPRTGRLPPRGRPRTEPSDKAVDQLDDMERLLAEMDGYEPIGDSWRHVLQAPQQPTGRELPGMDLPGF